MRLNKTVIILFIFSAVALILRIYKLSFFEYKNDQLYMIQLGEQARQMHFLLSHGIASGISINNPPLFAYFMGVVTFFSSDPMLISALFMLISTIGFFFAINYLYKNLPLPFSILSSAILAFSPAFTTYTAYIWPQCLLPILAIFFHKQLYGLIKAEAGGSFFISLVILTTLASQLHMSGFFLFPLLILIGYYFRKKISVKDFWFSIVCVFVISLPYLYHLIFEGEFRKFISFGQLSQRHIYWKIFREHVRMASLDFFRYYFPQDFHTILDRSLGISGFVLYVLSCVLIAFFAFSLLAYLFWIIKHRKLFDNSAANSGKYPLLFQISGFIIVGVTIGYLLLHIQTPPHYLIVLFPSYAIFSAYPAYRLWKFFWIRALTLASILSTLVLLITVLIFLKNAGGHPNEFGPHYWELIKWRNSVWAMVPEGYCPEVTLIGKDKFDKDTINSVIMYDRNCENKPRIPLKLIVNWDKKLLKYEYSITREQ